ncbi:type II toxin-antitoxin system RelE/ParE family toxin [Tabrizicola sp.]|uniref:type II toxin-antitoxin system RelE/ParE family toxin n=1 Tax=Tabrizicola sp. TaxID=2005166 RepID=UPI002FDCFC53
MKLIISPLAAHRLREIQALIALDGNLNAALRVVLRIRQAAEMLTDFPRMAPRWQGGSTRALVVSGLPYRIHYRVLADAVEIMTITHTSQKPQRFL